MKQKTAASARVKTEHHVSVTKSNLFDNEPSNTHSRVTQTHNRSGSRPETTLPSTKSIPTSSAATRTVDSASVSRPLERDRYSSVRRDDRGHTAVAPDRRRSSPRASNRNSRSPSPVRSRQDPPRGRDSRSPSRQSSQPVRFGRVEKIRPDEVNSYSTKRPYESSYDVGATLFDYM